MQLIVAEISKHCEPHLTALLRVELGARYIVVLNSCREYAPVVVTGREAVHLT